MAKGDPTTIFSVALTKKGSGSNDSKVRTISPFHKIQMLIIILYGLMVVPFFLLKEEYPKVIPFIFVYKKKKKKEESENWDLRG